MKKLILDIMYNLYVLNIIKSNRYLRRYIKELKDENDEEMVYRIRMTVLSNTEN